MATSEVLTASEHGALDQVLRPHLRLEPVPEQPQDAGTQHDKGGLIPVIILLM